MFKLYFVLTRIVKLLQNPVYFLLFNLDLTIKTKIYTYGKLFVKSINKICM